MSLSFFLWLLISSFLLGFWAWTSYVLYAQKRAWKVFAAKRKLRYESNGLYESPSISGAIEEYKVLAFTSDHSEYDARSQRRLTSIEVTLHSAFPTAMAVASGGMVPVIETVRLAHELKPEAKGWDDSYIIRTADKGIVSAYFNEKRMKILLDLMKIPKVWVVLIFYDGGALLRLDTPVPLSNPNQLDKMMKNLITAATAFELEKGEAAVLLKKGKAYQGASATLEVEENMDYELELEDEMDAPLIETVEDLQEALKSNSDKKG